MQSVQERIEIMQAWLDGKRVQWKSRVDGSWNDMLGYENPDFSFDARQYRIAPPEPDFIDWSHVADKWKWLARDANGEAWLYDNEPECRHISSWGGRGNCIRASEFASYRNGGADWRESLFARPTLENNFNGKGAPDA